MKKLIFIILLLFTFIGISTCGANSAIDAAVELSKQNQRQKEHSIQQINKASEKLKNWACSLKMKKIEKALLKLDTWDKTSLMRIMDKYNASLEEMTKAMSNVNSFNKHVR